MRVQIAAGFLLEPDPEVREHFLSKSNQENYSKSYIASENKLSVGFLLLLKTTHEREF